MHRAIPYIILFIKNKDESSIRAVKECNNMYNSNWIVQDCTVLIGVDFAETRVKDDILFVTEKTKFY